MSALVVRRGIILYQNLVIIEIFQRFEFVERCFHAKGQNDIAVEQFTNATEGMVAMNKDKMDALYYAFITATTVGYGDYRPSQRSGKILAIVIAFAGLLLTGIIVAIGVKAASAAFQHIHDISSLQIYGK